MSGDIWAIVGGRRALLIGCLIGWVVLSPSPIGAHEIGTTRVIVSISTERRFDVELSTDAASLLARLEALAGRLRSEGLIAEEYRQRIAGLCPELLKHLSLRVDNERIGSGVDCAVEMSADPEAVAGLVRPRAIVRLGGVVPAGARTLAWSYDLTYASYALTITDRRSGSKPDHVEWLEGGQASRIFTLDQPRQATSRMKIAATYLALGFTHILPNGVDHILFVLGIFLFSHRLRPMLSQVTTFTVAHSITLGLTLYGVVSLPASIVEPAIALSIVCVAVENLLTCELKPRRLALVFAFGLLHGMGFAGVLKELGLPRAEFLTGLVTFNLGVEAGQLTVITGAFLLVASWLRGRESYRTLVVIPGSALIALVGIYWTIERLGLA